MILSQSIAGDRDFEWRDLAACQGMAQPRDKNPDTNPDGKATDLFFDTYEEDEESRFYTEAVCASCPVRENCLMEALDKRYSGLWGGVWLDNGRISE